MLVCRYGFPREASEKTTLNSISDYTASRKKMYTLKRSYTERFVNDYNPLILLIWESNIDIQFVNDPSGILNR
jgi:hypothetical protein